MRVVTIVGTRPQLVKTAALSRSMVAGGIEELLVHTGQHYDHGMSGDFFAELGIPTPWRHLEVGAGPVPVQTGRMLERLAPVLAEASPDAVVVPGDTTSTLAGALAAVQLGMPLAHVEAGLRSFRRSMPEERNRVLTDRLAEVLYAPSAQAVRWLADEGIEEGVELVGDVMRDVLEWQRHSLKSDVLDRLGLTDGGYVVVTIHRAENTDDSSRLGEIVQALQVVAERWPVVFPAHPRTRKALRDVDLGRLIVLSPLSHTDLLSLVASARAVATDSGGLQKEAYWLTVPCVTLREETEWVETVYEGWNVLVGASRDVIVEAVESPPQGAGAPNAYGTPGAADRIVKDLQRRYG